MTFWLFILVVFLAVTSGCDRGRKIASRKAVESLVSHHPEVMTCGEETTWTMSLKVPPSGIAEGGQIIVVYNEVFRGDSTGIDHEAHLDSRNGANLEEIPFEVPEVNEKQTRMTGDYPQIRMSRFSVFVHYKIVGAPLVQGDTFTLTLKGKPFPYPSKRGYIPIFIDKEGNNVFERLPPVHTPKFRIAANEPATIRVVSPMIVQTGEVFDVRCIVLDRFNNPPSRSFEGTVSLTSSDPEMRIREQTLSLGLSEREGFWFKGVVLNTPGIQFITVSGDGLQPHTIPIDCKTETPDYRLFWGLLHVHSNLSDGKHSPDVTYRYGRDVGMLDFCALADHNQLLDEEKWRVTKDLADRFYLPGQFVTFAGYEWSTSPGIPNRGYRQVYFLDSKDAEIFKGSTNDVIDSFLDDRVLLVAQLRAGADWDSPQPIQQRLVEIHTGFATNENTESLLETTFWRYTATETRKNEISNYGTFQSGLSKGYRLGVIADGDDHSSTPGRCYFDGGSPNEPNKLGLAAVFAQDLTREDLFRSLYDRHCYGTTGERIFIDFRMDRHRMGSEYETAFPQEIAYRVGSPYDIARLEIPRDNEVIRTVSGDGKIVEGVTADDAILPGTHYYYLRTYLITGDRAWSSPIWVTKKERINEILQ
jgi:hypothetical protein